MCVASYLPTRTSPSHLCASVYVLDAAAGEHFVVGEGAVVLEGEGGGGGCGRGFLFCAAVRWLLGAVGERAARLGVTPATPPPQCPPSPCPRSLITFDSGVHLAWCRLAHGGGGPQGCLGFFLLPPSCHPSFWVCMCVPPPPHPTPSLPAPPPHHAPTLLLSCYHSTSSVLSSHR